MKRASLQGITGALALALAACTGEYDGGDEAAPAGPRTSGPLQPRIESIQEHVFTPHCASCHSGPGARNGLSLDDAQTSYDQLVNVRATEYPLLFRVEPGNAADSYLVHKLEGTQEVGERMPLGQAPLTPEQIAVIRQWIDEGAAPPAADSPAPPLFLPMTEL